MFPQLKAGVNLPLGNLLIFISYQYQYIPKTGFTVLESIQYPFNTPLIITSQG